MVALVLGPRGRKRQSAGGKVDLVPAHVRDLVASAARQEQQLPDPPERPSDTFEGAPNNSDFIVGKDTVAAPLRRWRLHPIAGTPLDDPPLCHRPAAHIAEVGEDPIRPNGRAPVDDLVEHLVHMSARDLGKPPALPAWGDFLEEDSLRLAPIACLRLDVPLDEERDDLLDPIDVGLALGLSGRSDGLLAGRRVLCRRRSRQWPPEPSCAPYRCR